EDEYMKKLIIIMIVLAFSIPVFSQKRLTQSRTKEEVLNEKYCSGLFSTLHADYFDFLDERVNTSAMGYMNVLDWLQGRVAGLQVYTTTNNVRIPFIRNQRAGVFVDEMWVSYDFLSMLPVMDIAMIKIIKGPFLGGWGSPGGAIAIYTIPAGDDEDNSKQ
ncbi:MAG: hypothetical protein ACXWWC_14795, partial [Chitinophagaceae bacterium]